MGHRSDKLDPEKLGRIIAEAAKEFSAFGYEGASLNRVLAGCGVSKGYAYYYFVDKADLFALIVKEYWDQTWKLVDFKPHELSEADFWDKMVRIYVNGAVVTVENPWMVGFAQALWSLPKVVKERPDVIAVMDRHRQFLANVLKRGQELGLVRNDLPIDLLLSIASGVEEAFDRWIAGMESERIRQDLGQLVELGMDVVRRLYEKRPAQLLSACG